MIRDAQEIKSLALKYSKPQLAHMAQMGLIDTQKAVLAAMMRDRIAKEDAKPPTTTVAQDVMGVQPQQIAPVSEPPQMGMAQAPVPMMPEQMAATGGLTSIPIKEQEYAGGGIVAFADGGISHYLDGGITSADDIFTPVNPMSYGEQMSNAFGAIASAPFELIRRIVSDPSLSEDQKKAEVAKVKAAQVAETQSPAETARLNRQNVAPVSTFTAPTTAPAAAQAAAPAATNARPNAPRMPAPPSLPPIGNVKMAAIEEQKMPAKETIQQALGRQEEADKAAGVDTGIFEKLRGEYEGKKGKVNERKQEAIGMAIMQTGLGLMGASRGREFAALGESGQKALSGLVASNEKIRDYEEKLEDKQRDLLLAQNDYNRTRSKSAQDRVQRIEDKTNELENKAVDARNKREETMATISSQTRGQDITARGQDLSYRAHMAQIGQMARPGETERLMSQYQELYKKDPAAAAKWLENLGTIRGIGKPQNTFSFEEAMKLVAAKPQNINATPQQLAQQARELMAAGTPGGAAVPRVGGAVDTSNPLLR